MRVVDNVFGLHRGEVWVLISLGLICSSLCASRSGPFAKAGSENLPGIKSEMLARLAASLEFMPSPDNEYITAGASMIRKTAAIARPRLLTDHRALGSARLRHDVQLRAAGAGLRLRRRLDGRRAIGRTASSSSRVRTSQGGAASWKRASRRCCSPSPPLCLSTFNGVERCKLDVRFRQPFGYGPIALDDR